MKFAGVGALLIFVGWSLLAIVQLWADVLAAEHFLKVTITAGILLLVLIAVRGYSSERKLKDDGFLDG
ncbi:hypothetical protein K5Q02_00635 [Pseudomonas sp. MM211]|uniref:hypothetical protein n=1 Tax=Pseudomonas sp. MM211 TaxID=2866808 RepID=UPI001CECEA25|nr:hypothetical protein [Pseudomonas sp. MM211]UCJ16945.1 hypothetical protein K5Q02_00635 [Pseudomonas sp. MM211]